MGGLYVISTGRNALRRLRREARLLADTEPAVARAYDLDPMADTATLVMEYVPGVTLDDLVAVSTLPAAAALDALRDVAETLRAMHESGLVHGNIGPAAIYVLPDGHAALGEPGEVPPGIGTLTPPDEDAYDFAVLAFELLTGLHPLDPRTVISATRGHTDLPAAAAAVLEQALTSTGTAIPAPHDLVASLDAVTFEDWGRHTTTPPPDLSPRTHLAWPPLKPMWVGSLEDGTIELLVEPAPPSDHVAPGAPATRAPVINLEATLALVLEPVVEQTLVVEPIDLPPVVEIERTPDLELLPVLDELSPDSWRPVKRGIVRRVGPFFAILCLLGVIGAGGYGGSVVFAGGAPRLGPMPVAVQVQDVSMTVSPFQAYCPRADLHLVASIATDGGVGDVRVTWRLPDGTTPEQTVTVKPGQRLVQASLDIAMKGRIALDGKAVATVHPSGLSATVPIRYLCAREGR